MNLDGTMTNSQVPFNSYGHAEVGGSRHGQPSKGVNNVGKEGLVKRTFVPVKKS